MSVFVASIGFGLVTAAVLAVLKAKPKSPVKVLTEGNVTLTAFIPNDYGGVMIVAAYAAYVLNNAGVNIWIATLAAIVCGAVVSVFLNNVVYTPFKRRGASPIALVIVSLGMTLILEFGTQALAGPTNVSYNMSQGATVKVGSLKQRLEKAKKLYADLREKYPKHPLLAPATSPSDLLHFLQA